MALLSVLLATVLLSALGLGLALLGIEETMLAGHERMARSLRQASMGAAQLAVADLRRIPVWDVVLASGASARQSAATSRLVDVSVRPASPWDGSVIDLEAMTDRLQALTDAERGSGDGPQTWRLFDYGRLEATAPGGVAAPWYLAVWVADDRADIDGDPLRDANGILAVHAVALGPSDALAATDVSVQRTAAGRVRVLTVRPGW